MGVLSELVIADEMDAQAVGESDSPSRQWDGIAWKSIDQIKLSTLWVLLGGVPVDTDEVMQKLDTFKLLFEESENGPWVFLIPRELRDRLAEMGSKELEDLDQLTRSWATTDEMQGWHQSEVVELIHDLSDLSERAKLDGKELLLWMSL